MLLLLLLLLPLLLRTDVFFNAAAAAADFVHAAVSAGVAACTAAAAVLRKDASDFFSLLPLLWTASLFALSSRLSLVFNGRFAYVLCPGSAISSSGRHTCT